MNTNIKATNIPLTEAITEFVNKRLSSLEKFAKDNEEISVYVEVGKTTKHHKQGEYFRAEFHVVISGTEFYTFSEKEDLYKAVDDAKEQVVRKITNRKDRQKTLFKRGALAVKKMIKGISDRNPFTSKRD